VLRLFYFSGTGNARQAAHWIASAWRSAGREATVGDLATLDPRAVHLDAGDVVGFASPTHGFNFPPITLSFLLAFPRAPGRNRALVVNTRGGVRLAGVCLPGLSGVAQLLAALILLLKGYRVVGMRPIDLPSSWISLHPGLREDNIRFIHARCAAITRRFAERLLGGGRDLRALWDLPQDLLVAPISLGYYFIGRFYFAKSFVASRDCDACGVCVKQCPTRALRLVDGRPFWSWGCESCMRCMNLCPRRAIETAHGFVIAAAVLAAAAARWLVAPAMEALARFAWSAGPLGGIARFLLQSVLALAGLFAAYDLMHRALRFRAVERLVVWTSLTHFAFWRRYRGPRPKDSGRA
jgi:ferredoxin